ncbi:ABC transporter ATP-binding protein/permease [Rickettsiella endosymbiont of Rhagonycha lignosa]|uniref:ABC transporter ATP-binding protein/permease n=1 Tax=Rickettsiella endosymbiont of Rhagonycha lignosa TaxID=3077937 RepID=UPI00313BA33D
MSFWRLLKPYWQSDEKKLAYLLLFLNVFFTFAAVEGNVWFSYSSKNVMNALQHFNKPLIWQNLIVMALVITFMFLAFGFAFYVNGLLALRWRQWLTKNTLANWLANKNYYRFQFLAKKIDNPDQRINEDIDQFTQLTLMITFQVLQSLTLFVSFGIVLWRIGNLSIPLGHLLIPIPGYLFWAACLFGGVGIWLTNRIGKKLISYNYHQQRYNANFRFALIKFRESRDEIALQRGEQSEASQFNALFKKIYHNFIDIIQLKKRLSFLSNGFNFASIPIATLIAIPLFLSKKIQFGGLTQITIGFGSVVASFTTLMQVYSSLTEWNSIIVRLTELNSAIEHASTSLPSKLMIQKNNLQNQITLNDLNLFLPDGQLLIGPLNLSLDLSENYLIKGGSGLGKSSLMRTLAGVWPFAEGTIYFPKDKTSFFLSQKTFFPLGTLKESFIYPTQLAVTDDDVRELLRRFGLAKFQDELNEIQPWQQICSPGEQQLMALIRTVLNKPDILFLDEATSALDDASQINAYQNLRLLLPNTSLISIGHRADLEQFHRKILLFSRKEPASIVSSTRPLEVT